MDGGREKGRAAVKCREGSTGGGAGRQRARVVLGTTSPTRGTGGGSSGVLVVGVSEGGLGGWVALGAPPSRRES